MPDRPSLSPEALTQLRLDRCLSQVSLAELAGMTERTIRRLENGEHGARLSTIRKLASALNTPIERLTAVA